MLRDEDEVKTSDMVFYILMRTDLESMNPGKAMAQSSHAYGALKSQIRMKVALQPAYLEWMNTTQQDFGTTLVLGGNRGQIDEVLARIRKWMRPQDVACDWVFDPEYPIRDGEVTHLIPLHTCAFIFGKEEDIGYAVRHLDRHQ